MKRLLLILSMKPNILVGGQAVIEGVMMRVPGAYATAVKNPKGDILIDCHPFSSLTLKGGIFNLPIIRGIIHLYESMKIGYGTLQWDADNAMPSDKEQNKILDSILTIFSILFAIGLFFIIPIYFASYIESYFNSRSSNVLLFNIISGFTRISLFLTYLYSISFMKDVNRLFQYHGAEHKVVYNFESGEDLNIENAQKFKKEHPRCGTSFIFIVMIVAIISFSMIDLIISTFFIKDLTPIIRILFHLLFLPLVAGFSYEVLKFIAKHQKHFIFQILSYPGLMLQKITTQEPTNNQVDIALQALSSAFGNNLYKYKGQEYQADAIG